MFRFAATPVQFTGFTGKWSKEADKPSIRLSALWRFPERVSHPSLLTDAREARLEVIDDGCLCGATDTDRYPVEIEPTGSR